MLKTHLQKCTALLLSIVLCFGLVGCNTTPTGTTENSQSEFELGSGADTPEEALDGLLQGYFQMDDDMIAEYTIPQFEGGSVWSYAYFPETNPDYPNWNTAILNAFKSLTEKQTYEIVTTTILSDTEIDITVIVNQYSCKNLISAIFIQPFYDYENGSRYVYNTYLYYSNITNYAETFPNEIPLPELQEREVTLHCVLLDAHWYVVQPDLSTVLLLTADYQSFLDWDQTEFADYLEFFEDTYGKG